MMDIKIKTCIFNYKKGKLSESVNLQNIEGLGFKCETVDGTINDLLQYLNKNRMQIVIMDATGEDLERFDFATNLIYVNYCKNIIVINNNKNLEQENIRYLSSENLVNLDLKLSNLLLEMKNIIEKNPANNVALIKGKIHDFLGWFKLSPRYTGFQYFLDICTVAFFNYPERINIVKMYDIVGQKYGKSGYAIEKSMRTALTDAIKTIRSLPASMENKELKEHVKHEIGNLAAVNIIVSKLLIDGDFGGDLYR